MGSKNNKLTEDRIMEIFSEASTTYNEMKQVTQNQKLRELIEKLRNHPYNLGEQMIVLAKIPVMERDILRQKLARLINQTLQKLLEDSKK